MKEGANADQEDLAAKSACLPGHGQAKGAKEIGFVGKYCDTPVFAAKNKP